MRSRMYRLYKHSARIGDVQLAGTSLVSFMTRSLVSTVIAFAVWNTDNAISLVGSANRHLSVLFRRKPTAKDHGAPMTSDKTARQQQWGKTKLGENLHIFTDDKETF